MKMPSPGRLSDEQFCHLAWLARHDCSLSGKLYMRVHENPAKWQLKWFALYQNFLFYFENEDTAKLSGSIFLEHSTCERLCMTNLKDSENQVSRYMYVVYTIELKTAVTLGAVLFNLYLKLNTAEMWQILSPNRFMFLRYVVPHLWL